MLKNYKFDLLNKQFDIAIYKYNVMINNIIDRMFFWYCQIWHEHVHFAHVKIFEFKIHDWFDFCFWNHDATNDESTIDRFKCDCKNIEFENFEIWWFNWQIEKTIDLIWWKMTFSKQTKRTKNDFLMKLSQSYFWCCMTKRKIFDIDVLKVKYCKQLKSFIVERWLNISQKLNIANN